MRRVLHVVEATDAGVGRHVLDLVSGLSETGWETHLMYSPLRMGAAFGHRLESMDGVTSVELPMKRSIHPVDAVSVWSAVRYLRNAGPFDLIHGHSSKGGAIARLAGRAAGVPSAYTPNAMVTMNPELGPLKNRAYRLVERWLGRLGTVLIAVSDVEREHAIGIGLDAEAVAVVPNGIPLEVLPDREFVRGELEIDSDVLVVGFVGRLFAQKALDILLRAFAQSAACDSNVVLAIVGDGPLKAEMEQLAQDLGISDCVRWLGTRNGQQAMPAFDVFVLPSLYEGMPYVVLEAAHAGLPIIASRVSGIASVVRNGVNGYTVDAGDVVSLSRALDAVLLDTELRRRFSESSLSRVQEWTVQRMVGDTIQVYEQILDGKRSAASHVAVQE